MTEQNKPSRDEREEQRRQQAERALARVDMEGEALGTSAFARTANKAKGHLGAQDADPDDLIEVWGNPHWPRWWRNFCDYSCGLAGKSFHTMTK